jgi:hypothetical protein
MTDTQTLEQLFNDTESLLRCAKATAYESADSLRGEQRDHALSVVHLLEVAQASSGRYWRCRTPGANNHREGRGCLIQPPPG